jgi:hypothetical protein
MIVVFINPSTEIVKPPKIPLINHSSLVKPSYLFDTKKARLSLSSCLIKKLLGVGAAPTPGNC